MFFFHAFHWYINWKNPSKITCSTVSIFYYLKCNMCKLETYIIKAIVDANIGSKTRMSNDIPESRTCISSCKFPKHVYQCGSKNGNLIEPFFQIDVTLTTNDPAKLEYLENYFQSKGYMLNNPLRNS